MKNFFLTLAVIICICASACAPVVPTAEPPVVPATPAATVVATSVSTPNAVSESEFDGERALEQNRMLAVTIGKRVAGTEGGTRAGNYIADQFSSFGYQVEQQAFPFEAWEDRGTTVQVTAPETREIESQPIQYSPAGQVEAPLVAVGGIGTADDFKQVDVKGKIALVARGTIPFSDKALNAVNAGAAAVLIYNNVPGLIVATLRERVSIPAIVVSQESGNQLLDLLKRGAVTIKIASDTLIATKTGHNIIAIRAGESDKTLVLGGHYDSVPAGPGANDNGSGTAVLLELARALAQHSHKDTLIFIAFDAEELGLVGSRYYVEHLDSAARAKIQAMLNFDMLGGGSGPLLLGGNGSIALTARSSAQTLGIEAHNFTLGGGAGSDHESFQRANIDTVFFSRDYTLLHTPQDVIDQVRAEYLAEAGRVAERVIERLDE